MTALVVILLGSACGGDGPGAPVGTGPPDAGAVDAGTVAVRVEHVGGFVPATELAARSPVVTVYGDGRVITDGPVPEMYPGPALPDVQQWSLPADEVAVLVRTVIAAGVGSGVDFGRPSVTDMPDTRFTVTTGAGVRRASVYALDPADEGASGSLTDAQRAARAALRAVLDDLTEPRGAPGPFPVSPLAVISVPYRQPDAPVQAPVAWPGPALPGDPVAPDGPDGTVGCVTVTGEAAKAVLAAAATANAATPWTGGGKTWSLRFRPLLPDETGCADLASRR